MASQDTAQSQLSTQHIQMKLEENFNYLVKIVAANQKAQNGGLDPTTQAQVEQWSKQLQENLMNLAGQADKSTAGQQPAQPQKAAPAAAPQGPTVQAPLAASPAVAGVMAQPTASSGSSMTPSKAQQS